MKTPYDHEYLVKFLLFPLKEVTPVVLAKLIYHDTESFLYTICYGCYYFFELMNQIKIWTLVYCMEGN